MPPGASVAIYELLLADRERILGAEHHDTLTTRHELAAPYRAGGRDKEAAAILDDPG